MPNLDLLNLMHEPLPNISYQKKMGYRTHIGEVENLYKLINESVFDNKLSMPEIIVKGRCRQYWGVCFGEIEKPDESHSYCRIKLMDKWFCRQWLITTLAHEMCHQYQWDIISEERKLLGKEPIMSHGPTFFIHRPRLAEHMISLKRYHGMKSWFKTQDFFKS
jgi:hypothetical protein